MKTFAFFLPQFHEIAENDIWWGKGYTEWTSVKKARPLYEGHIQPKTPYNENYYHLLDKKTVIWQTQMAKEYFVDGFIYYHYYFKGKKLLEKPAENLLKWKDVNQRFFFCWANHSWVKSVDAQKSVLMPMEYGDEEDWEQHFQYLLPFFKDDRYEKKDGMPLFMIFDPDFEEKEKMLRFFDTRCKEEGFEGIWSIETFFGDMKYEEFISKQSSITKRVFLREPAYTREQYRKSIKHLNIRIYSKLASILIDKGIRRKPRVYDGNSLMKYKLENELFGENIIHGLWFEWDNTPRHGKHGYVITPYKKDLFDQFMNSMKNEEYLFINAWNEWAEGMMLEPTEDMGYKYLEWIKDTI